MKKHLGILPVLILCAALLPLGCDNFLMPPHSMETKASEGIVIVSMSAGRAALSPETMSFDEVEFEFFKGAQTIKSALVETSANKDNHVFILPVGTGYSLNVNCYSGTGSSRVKAATGDVGSFNVASGSQELRVPLQGILTGGHGNFKFNISYPDDAGIDEIYLFIDDSNSIPLLASGAFNSAGGKKTFSGQKESIPAGWYLLVAILARDDGKEAGYANGVAIYPGQTTDWVYEFDETFFFEYDNKVYEDGPPSESMGKLLILQAYGSNSTAAGVNRSFVELYNTTTSPINLNGFSLQYANGYSTNANGDKNATPEKDTPWNVMLLAGVIPARGSFLIYGPEQSSSARFNIPDMPYNEADIYDENFTLNNRAFKVVLLESTNRLYAQDPFNLDGGLTAAGYVDMVGARNTDGTDVIHGYETGPARCSASEAVRRKDLNDTNDNAEDFIAARYASGGMSDDEIILHGPRNSSAGEWDPFGVMEIVPQNYSSLRLNEVSGVGDDSEKFYELINTGSEDINLLGCKIYYNANGSTGQPLPGGLGNLTWTGLSTQVIEAGQLFSLIGRDSPAGTNPGSFTTGLTAQRNLIITLSDPEGNVIDQCIRARDTGDYAFTDKSFSRIPDGSGLFYFTEPSPDVENGINAAGLTEVPDKPAEPPVTGIDYTKLRLNEVSGVGADEEKFYELFNIGTDDINLAGVTIEYDGANKEGTGFPPVGGGQGITWTGSSDQVIEAGQLFSLIGRNAPGSFTTGLTAGRILIITLRDPGFNIIDQCIRSEDTAPYDFTDKSFSRIPDGTGPFYFTEPTCDVTNGTDTTGLVLLPDAPVVITAPTGITELVVSGITAGDLGLPASSYSGVVAPGSLSISRNIGSANIEVDLESPEASFRTAKVSGLGSPLWGNSTSFTFNDGDFLCIEVTNGISVSVYKIKITLTDEGSTVKVGGNYLLELQSVHAQSKVVIEAYSSPDLQLSELLGNVIAQRGSFGKGTWEMYVPNGQNVWFKVMVTDSTGFTFGKTAKINGSAESGNYTSNDPGVNLTLSYDAKPVLNSLTLVGAAARAGARYNKTAPGSQQISASDLTETHNDINQATGLITFGESSFTSFVYENEIMIVDFHKMPAKFDLPQGCELYAGNVRQIPCECAEGLPCVCGSTTNNYYNEVVFTVRTEDNASKTYRVPGAAIDPVTKTPISVVGTNSWQTQGFGVLNITTTDTTTGLPPPVNKLYNFWNTTGSYTYIGPTGRVVEGGTDIRGRGNYSMTQTPPAYALKLNSEEGFEYYDYKTKSYQILPAHRRWVLLHNHASVELGHGNPKELEVVSRRINFALSCEMGRHVLTNMSSWQPYSDWVFVFLNGKYRGLYELSEDIRIDTGRLDVGATVSAGSSSGSYLLEMNNVYWYGNTNSSAVYFDEMYNFMTSHQNPVSLASFKNRQQGVLWSFSSPDNSLGWPDPFDGTTQSDRDNSNNFPKNGHILAATLSGTNADGYNRPSNPVGLWKVPGPESLGDVDALLPEGHFGQNDGGINVSTTLGGDYAGRIDTTFVKVAQFLQDAEDAIYSHDYNDKGYGNGSWQDYIDIDSLIDWHIAQEMISNWEMIYLNGQYVYFDPRAGGPHGGRLKMGPLWDTDGMWDNNEKNAFPGFMAYAPFWIKELLGVEMGENPTGAEPGHQHLGFGLGAEEKDDRFDPYYAERLVARWNQVKGRFADELFPFIDLQDARFTKIQKYNNTAQPIAINGNRQALKTQINAMVNRLDYGGWTNPYTGRSYGPVFPAYAERAQRIKEGK